jgi:glycerol kinase
LLDRPVLRSRTAELSGLGAAFAAGLGAGFWSSPDELAAAVAPHDPFAPAMDDDARKRLVLGWSRAVESVKMVANK